MGFSLNDLSKSLEQQRVALVKTFETAAGRRPPSSAQNANAIDKFMGSSSDQIQGKKEAEPNRWRGKGRQGAVTKERCGKGHMDILAHSSCSVPSAADITTEKGCKESSGYSDEDVPLWRMRQAFQGSGQSPPTSNWVKRRIFSLDVSRA